MLKPGGRYLFNTWSAVAQNPHVGITLAVLANRYPRQSSWLIDRVAYGYHDPAAIRADLAAGGFKDCRIDTVTLAGPVLSAEAAAIGYCQGTPIRGEILAQDPDGLQPTTEEVARALAARYGTGAFEIPITALVVEVTR